jgi:N-acetylglucosaminyldiphosphoundecaprenol N-acetyl-beta-D-mannosaminyltransferase
MAHSSVAGVEPAASLPRDAPMRERETSRQLINVLGIPVDVLTIDQALTQIGSILREGTKGYVCAIGVHGVMEARRDSELAAAFAGASMAIPDGMPMAWVGRWQGHRGMERVAGPDLMREMLLREEFSDYTHFFYGGAKGVAEQLAANFRRLSPGCKIVGTYTPPFRDLTPDEERELVRIINRANPDMIWVGIGSPKQDKFMRRFLPQSEVRLMFGVGAAFDFHTGRIRDCAPWVKRAGLQWLHRLAQDPKRLWWRYLRNNPLFLWHITLQLTGLRSYAPFQSGRSTRELLRDANA